MKHNNTLRYIAISLMIMGSLILIITSWSEIFFVSLLTILTGIGLYYVDEKNKNDA